MGINGIYYRGNIDLILNKERELLAVFCSDKASASILLQLHDLAKKWRYQDPIIISGFQSEGENEVLSVLLQGSQPIIICMAREIKALRIKQEWKTPFKEGRLLLVSQYGGNIKRGTYKTGYQRNIIAAKLADQVLIAHAQPGSKTEKMAKEIIEWGIPVFTLKSKFNNNLIKMGIKEIEGKY